MGISSRITSAGVDAMRRTWISVGSIIILLLSAIPETRTGACLIDPCQSSASSAGGVLMVCPAGDGPTLSSIDATISVTLRGCSGEPVPGMPPQDFWIQAKGDPQLLCGGYLSSNADSTTNLNGQTTISGSIAAGGYLGDGVYAVALGFMIQGTGGLCDNPLSLVLVSPDIDGDLIVDLVDFSIFAQGWPPRAYDPRSDMNSDGLVDLVDLALFATHYSHSCV